MLRVPKVPRARCLDSHAWEVSAASWNVSLSNARLYGLLIPKRPLPRLLQLARPDLRASLQPYVQGGGLPTSGTFANSRKRNPRERGCIRANEVELRAARISPCLSLEKALALWYAVWVHRRRQAWAVSNAYFWGLQAILWNTHYNWQLVLRHRGRHGCAAALPVSG